MKIDIIQEFSGPSIHAQRPVIYVQCNISREMRILSALDNVSLKELLLEIIPSGILKRMPAFNKVSLVKGKETDFLGLLFCQFTIALQRLDETGPGIFYKIGKLEAGKFPILLSYFDYTVAGLIIRASADIMKLMVDYIVAPVDENIKEQLRQSIKVEIGRAHV